MKVCTAFWDNPEISDFALYRTLSGIDTTPEDTSHAFFAVVPAVKRRADLVSPKIRQNAGLLTIDVMGQDIDRVEVVRMNGSLTKTVMVPRSQVSIHSIAPGVYLVKITADGGLVFTRKIAVSR